MPKGKLPKDLETPQITPRENPRETPQVTIREKPREAPPQVTVREKPREAPPITIREKPRETPPITIREKPRETPPITIRERGKLPTAREMEDWVLVATQELGGEAQFKRIDAKVKELLAYVGVPKRELDRKIKHSTETTLNLKTSRGRTALRKRLLLERAPGKGRWRLTASGEVRATFRRQELLPDRSTIVREVNKLATDAGIKTDALAVLRDNNVPEEVLEKFLEQLVSAVSVLVDPDDPPKPTPHNLAVEKAAIRFIQNQKSEKGWHTTPPNNEGFDLYRTQSGRENGKKTTWCEVKGLSGKFTGVSLTRPEFKKAQECGDAYWLYIVEEAPTNPKLLKIQNPAGKVERFTYGHRWRNVAEK